MRTIKQQREQLRLEMLAINPQAWNDLIRLEGQIRKQRQIEEAERLKRQEEILTWAAITAGVSVFLIITVIILSRIFP